MPAPAVSLVHVRWALRRDLPAMVAIEARSHFAPWSEADFLAALAQRKCISMVAETHAGIAGFMVYELHPNRLRLLNMAVDPALRRQSIGAALIDKLKFKTCSHRRVCVTADVWEGDLGAQLFFRAMGFRVTRIAGEGANTSYVFEWRPTADERARAGFPEPLLP